MTNPGLEIGDTDLKQLFDRGNLLFVGQEQDQASLSYLEDLLGIAYMSSIWIQV